MAEKIHFLVYDHSDPSDKSSSKITRARHSSLANAQHQAALDREHGRTVVAIEDAKGKIVWEP
jgi:hypothetical protein